MNNLSEWQSRLQGQDQGFFYWAVLVAGVVLVLIWVRLRWPSPVSNPRLLIRLVGVGIFLLSLALLANIPKLLNTVIPLGFVGAVAYGWASVIPARRHLLRIPPLALILAVGALLRLPGLFESFWYDETFTAMVATRNIGDMFTIIRGDVHPPGWYGLSWVIAHTLGSSEELLRLPAFLAGLALIWLVYRLAVALKMETHTALTAALLVAVLPADIYYSNEARAYTLLACVVVGMALAILEDKPRWFALVAVGAPVLHNLGYLYLGVMGLTALAYHHRRGWVLACVPAGAVALIWLPFLLGQVRDIADGFWLSVSPYGGLWPVTLMTVGWRTEDRFILHVTAVILGITMLGLFVGRRWIISPRGMVWLALVFGAPSIAFLLSLVWNPVFLSRAFLGSVAALTIAWAWLLNHVSLGDRRAALAVFVPALLIAIGGHYFDPRRSRDDMGALLAQGCAGADVIYNTSVHVHIITSYYSPLPQVLWPDANDTNQTLPKSAKLAAGWKVGELPRGKVCLLDFDTLLSKSSERAYVHNLEARYTVISRQSLSQNSLFTFDALVLDVL